MRLAPLPALPAIPGPADSVDGVEIAVEMSSRQKPTARAYRRGAPAPQKSSLHIFVLLGLAVGLFAFAVMSLCLEDPFAKMAERDAASPKAVDAVVAPPVVSAPPPVAEAPPPAADPIPAPAQTVAAKAPRAHRRVRKGSVKTALPAGLPLSMN
jgi:hypothetical protein